MYLSELLLDWSLSRNPYDIHKHLWGFFPGKPDADRPFLFRVSYGRDREPLKILMQSYFEPAESSAKGSVLLRKKEVNPAFKAGDSFRFLLCANPTKRLVAERCRVPLVDEDQLHDWLRKKLEPAAQLIDIQTNERRNLNFRKGGTAGKVVTVTFSGVLKVRDAEQMLSIWEKGIGTAKGFGCGLLSLARV